MSRAATAHDEKERGWVFGTLDGIILAGTLTLSLTGCLLGAMHLRSQTRAVDAERALVLRRTVALRQTLRHAQARRLAVSQLRRAVNRYSADVGARPIVPWTTVMGELSRQRPQGLWTVRITGEGPRFKAQVAAGDSGLIRTYAQRLRVSPYFEYAAIPAGGSGGSAPLVEGRLTGE
jgi:hypothetical protein